MNTSAFDLLRLMPEVERVSASKTMSDEQKSLVLTELLTAVPEPVFCGTSKATRNYVIETIQGALDGCTKKPTKKVPAKEGKRTSTSKSTEEELLRNADGDGRGQSVETPVVNKAPQKRRATKRSS